MRNLTVRRATRLMWMIACCSFFAGCATTQIQSDKSSSYKETPKRIFVVADTVEGYGSDFSNFFSSEFKRISESCGVVVQVSPIKALELDQSIHGKRLREFKPEAVLTILRESITTVDGAISQIKYDAKLLDASAKKTVWRTKIAFSKGGMFSATRTAGETLARDLANELIKAKIYVGCSVTKS